MIAIITMPLRLPTAMIRSRHSRGPEMWETGIRTVGPPE
jgi:hypothetical protein